MLQSHVFTNKFTNGKSTIEFVAQVYLKVYKILCIVVLRSCFAKISKNSPSTLIGYFSFIFTLM